MKRASAGRAMGPPWQSTMTSGFTARAAAAHASMRATQSLSVTAVSAPMAPPVVSPRWQTTMSAPALAMSAALCSEKT
jgi:hypothetical protein